MRPRPLGRFKGFVAKSKLQRAECSFSSGGNKCATLAFDVYWQSTVTAPAVRSSGKGDAMELYLVFALGVIAGMVIVLKLTSKTK